MAQVIAKCYANPKEWVLGSPVFLWGKPTRERNDKILISVLRGYSLREVGSIFGITGERVRQIVFKTVRKHDKKLDLAVREKFPSGNINEYRKHKNRLISIIRSNG